MWKHEIIAYRPPTLGATTRATFAPYVRRLEAILGLYGRNFSQIRVCDHDLFEPIVNLVLQRQDQLVHLSILSYRLYSKIRHFRMPRLEALFLTRDFDDDRTFDFNTPKLRKLFLHGQAQCPRTKYPNLPWAQLTHLSFGVSYSSKEAWQNSYQIGLRRLLKLLAVVPNLIYLHLTDFRPISVPQIPIQQDIMGLAHPSEIVTFPRLRVLEIHDKDLRSLTLAPYYRTTCFLPLISTPVLETFDLVFSMVELPGLVLPNLLQPLLQRAPILRRVRFVLCSSDVFLGCLEPTLSLRPILLKFTGDASFFARLKELVQVVVDGDGDGGFIQHGKRIVAPRKGALQGDIWLDRLIDRYFDEEEVEARRFRQLDPTPPLKYKLEERRCIRSMFNALSDLVGISGSVERHLCLAL